MAWCSLQICNSLGKLSCSSMRPNDLPFQFLEDITNRFSDERRLGSGGFGEVYKGVDKNGKEIAVKRLYGLQGLDDVQFKNELNTLMKARHRNIVRLVGYCYKDRHVYHKHDGENLLCKVRDRALCLEYMSGGSLDRHLNEESCGIDWATRYNIIKGICEGLSYLHGESIFHLDLKPGNILLDKNMMPKIADFGLSRLVDGAHTHVTNNHIGTPLYMPPEYISGNQISGKSDVFSLGIMIIQIIAGSQGYVKLNEMTPQQFIELVHENWRDRMEASPWYASREKDFQQVKRCIELALTCVETDKLKRPTVREIINELKQLETKDSAPPSDQDFDKNDLALDDIISEAFKKKSRLAKIGKWGGVGGNHHDIEVEPRHLKSLRIRSGKVIYSFEFSYYDHDGILNTAGPWGGRGPEGHGNVHDVINLGPLEFITELSGTIHPFGIAHAGVVNSLTFITNEDTYGPFGEVEGTSFSIPVQDGSIVGFFGRAGWYVDALGIYVNPNHDTGVSRIAKIGPWGGNGGKLQDIMVVPRRLESVKIWSGNVVNALMFTYYDQHGQQHTAGPWGDSGGSTHTETIILGQSEFLTGIHGTTGPSSHTSVDVVASLILVTNERKFGPYGESWGTPFQTAMWGKGTIVGFFGRATSCVNAIGIYIKPYQEVLEEELICSREPGYTKIGPWGGVGGNAQDIDPKMQPHRVESITITCGAIINSFTFSYTDFNGDSHTVGPWGSPAGNTYKIVFKPLETLNGVYGTVASFGTLPNVITSLAFTVDGGSYGPFGGGGGLSFSAPAEKDGCIVGFFGHAGSCLEALGVYVHRY